ncbi:MAG: hypothetical protein A2751_01200 [Candidatus Doudnabacteria bacterium RIFCSPHIGHO2_01_FULL_46_14]|uniref:AAA+ ATPase domain-containing protein n=1 Tax=Candidatus Doudnabacteria bacterium RIFCSPHIGHO2_01_FULL_46_14 TaxID=1817824 RepID=A0A1F5NM46_9BACT|nr:MAG: hypothetical protein A2751_01200 [Candidatus Doudnabacteria bacterium RIFCSPHIGHO2_01_FULL_46_14]
MPPNKKTQITIQKKASPPPAPQPAKNSEQTSEQKIKEILLAEDYVSAKDIQKAEEYAQKNKTSIVDYLLSSQLLTRQLLGQALAESFGVPYADLSNNMPAREQILLIPEEVARKYNVVLSADKDGEITVASDNPSQAASAVKKLFPGKKISTAYSLKEDIEAAFVAYRKPLETRFGKILEAKKRIAPEIIEEILEDALIYKASDIHFDPQEKEVVIRFRVDGVLREAGRVPKEHYENILNRIKVQAHLRIDEHFSAQDGAIRHSKNGKSVDLRVSIVPTLDGEKVVIRLLGEYVRSFTFSDIGLSVADQQALSEAAKKPYGMILVTGPTGSGKTTTLYSLLKSLNRPEVNVMSIEDPVEYKVTGMNQIQVSQQTNLTFAEGLRSIVRQDPNIILVGEIRDRETAEIAVNAALTGHLLFSSFHANDSATAIPRLLDMGIEPFLLASTLELVIAQRLVRLICSTCRYSVSVTNAEFKRNHPQLVRYFDQKNMTFYKGKGCKTCSDTGYRGRVAVFEVIPVDRELKDLILKNPSSKQVWGIARKLGAHSLFEDGIEKVKSGITTIDELLRVAAPPEQQFLN